MLDSYTEIALYTATFLISIKFIYLIRKRWKIDVPCWFCSTSNRIILAERNCFTCFKCLQYNGFTKDGGYNNRELEKQQRTRKNIRYCTANNHNTYSLLCLFCNKKQQAIVTKLNKFEAKNEKNWASEYAAYRSQLESEYPLCPRCILRTTVNLQKQKLDLTHGPNTENRQLKSSPMPLKPINGLLHWRNRRDDSVDRNAVPEFEVNSHEFEEDFTPAPSVRESTPSRELAPSLSGISLSSDDLDDSISVRERRTLNTPPAFKRKRSITSGHVQNPQPSLFSPQRSYANTVITSFQEPEGLNRSLIVLCSFFAVTAIASMVTLFYLISRLKLA